MKVRALVSILAALTLFAVLAVSPALASPQGPPDRVTISGPGLKGEVDVRGQERLQGLGFDEFPDANQRITEPPKVSSGYDLLRYFGREEISRPLDHLRYYPDPSGGRGFVLYVGADYNPAPKVGHWFYATPQGEATLQRLLKELGASPISEQTANESRSGGSSWSPRDVLVMGVSVAGAVLLSGGLLRLRRRTSKP